MSAHHVVGVGNAIVDVISPVEEGFVAAHGLAKGAMTLIDTERALSLYDAMPPGMEMSGGSAANTMVGVASFGGDAAYIGKVRDDQLGEFFRHDMRAAGVDYDVDLSAEGPPTARCLIQVTPDAARTMNTFLGISSLLAPDDVDEALVASGEILYCEGYLWDIDVSKAAIRKAVAAAQAAGRTVSFTLSDGFCVERHHREWLDLVDGPIDILFGNEVEICTLYETDDFDVAAAAIQGRCRAAFLTRSAKGSVIVTPDEMIEVPAEPVAEVVDTTGAGDLYAAGVLYGWSKGFDLTTCGRLGSIAAAEVIGHMGARPRVSLAALAAPILAD